jgi:hypothetical protein
MEQTYSFVQGTWHPGEFSISSGFVEAVIFFSEDPESDRKGWCWNTETRNGCSSSLSEAKEAAETALEEEVEECQL